MMNTSSAKVHQNLRDFGEQGRGPHAGQTEVGEGPNRNRCLKERAAFRGWGSISDHKWYMDVYGNKYV